MVGRRHGCRTSVRSKHTKARWWKFGWSESQPAAKDRAEEEEDDLTSRAKMGTLFAHAGTESKVWVEKYLACLL